MDRDRYIYRDRWIERMREKGRHSDMIRQRVR